MTIAFEKEMQEIPRNWKELKKTEYVAVLKAKNQILNSRLGLEFNSESNILTLQRYI
jgi:hypothetical protein